MKLIYQKHSRGCGVAMLAMLLGEDYDAVAARFTTRLEENGVYLFEIDRALFASGRAILRKFEHDARSGGVQWPPAPFADAHGCEVVVNQDSPCSHFVAMLRDGRVLDPIFGEEKRLTDYHRVYNVFGVFKVSPASENMEGK